MPRRRSRRPTFPKTVKAGKSFDGEGPGEATSCPARPHLGRGGDQAADDRGQLHVRGRQGHHQRRPGHYSIKLTSRRRRASVLVGHARHRRRSSVADLHPGVPPYAYVWDFAYRDSTQPTTGRTITHHWKNPGTYYVAVSVTDSTAPHANHGQSNFVPITVTCNPKTDPDRCGETQKPPKPPKTPCTACTGNEQGGHHPRTGPDDGRGHHSPDGTGRHDSPTGGPDGRHATGGPNGGNSQ